MSLHISVVAIQGDHIARAGELLGVFGFEVAGWAVTSKDLGTYATDGVVGEPLPEEAGFDRSRASECGVIGVLARIGFDFWSLEWAGRVLVYRPLANPRVGERKPQWRSW